MRYILWSILATYLLVVGLWPAAAAPVVLASTGAAVVVGKIPGVVLVGIAAITWLSHRNRPTSAPATA